MYRLSNLTEHDFIDALHDFVDGQRRRLEQAISSSSVEEAINATLDLQALFLILATRFSPYKRNVEDLRMRMKNKERWQRLVEILEKTIGENELEDLSRMGEHFAVLEVLPSMPFRDGEIQLPRKKLSAHTSSRASSTTWTSNTFRTGSKPGSVLQ